MTIYLSNGVDIDATWTSFIAVSKDNVHWEPINKSDLTPHGRWINQSSNPEFRAPYINKGTHALITLRTAFNESVVLVFDPNDVANQATWQGNDQAGLDAALSDLADWISS